MAQVATAAQARIDHLLNVLLEAWRGLPQAAEDIDSWDWADQVVYIEEWAVTLSHAERLAELMAGATTEQRRRYAELQRLRTEYMPILRKLQQS